MAAPQPPAYQAYPPPQATYSQVPQPAPTYAPYSQALPPAAAQPGAVAPAPVPAPSPTPAPVPAPVPAPAAAPSGSAQMAVPGPMSFVTCTDDVPCGTHHCNVQYRKCAFPCQTNVDCIAPNTCVVGLCVPAIPGITAPPH